MYNYNLHMNKFLIVHDFFKFRGGGEELMMSIAKNLECNIFTSYSNYPYYKIYKSKFSIFFKLSTFLIFIYFFLKKFKSDDNIIFSGTFSIFSIKKSIAKKKIIYAHSLPRTLFAESYKDFKFKWYLSLFYKFLKKNYYKNLISADYIFFNSKRTKMIFLNHFPLIEKNTKIDILYPFVETKIYYSNNKLKQKYFVINSRHDLNKKIEEIVKLFYSFCTKNNFRIYITSDGPNKKNLERVFKKKNIVIFTGYIPKDDYYELIKNSTAVISVNPFEDFGMSYLDAYNLDIPVIIYKSAGFSEILNESYNFFFDNSIDNVFDYILNSNYLIKPYGNNKFNLKDLFLKRLLNI